MQEIEMDSVKTKSFKEIVMDQFYKVVNFNNVEFRGGFYTKGITKTGEEKDIYVPDTRETLCNAVFALAILLQPKFTPDMKTNFKNIRDKLKKLTADFIKETSVEEKVVLGDSYYENEKDKILLEEYKNLKLILFLKLFSKITKELNRHKFFEISTGSF